MIARAEEPCRLGMLFCLIAARHKVQDGSLLGTATILRAMLSNENFRIAPFAHPTLPSLKTRDGHHVHRNHLIQVSRAGTRGSPAVNDYA